MRDCEKYVAPFSLQAPTPRPPYNRTEKIIYTKNAYSEGVKFRHWQDRLECKPIDVNPLCRGKVNQFLSHYHRIGTDKENRFETTTNEMLQQIFIKNKMTPNKLMKNYYTYSDNAECLTEYDHGNCPLVCADEFLTTMQHSYQVPHPYVMQRLAFPKIPFMQNQKYKQEDPDVCPTKFHGDNFDHDTCVLKKHKAFRWISYNPMTGTYTNVEGTPTE